MPQVFQVLKCSKCFIFQVQQVKKSNKWQCKVCGEKQSCKRHYGIGTAKDCRLHVQKLNSIKGEIYETKMASTIKEYKKSYCINNDKHNIHNLLVENTSKWSSHIGKSKENIEDSKDIFSSHTLLKSPKKCAERNKVYKKANNNKNYEIQINTQNVPYKTDENCCSDLNFDNSNFHIFNSDNEHTFSDTLVLEEAEDIENNKNSVVKFENALFYPVVKLSKWEQFLDKKRKETYFENEAKYLTDTVEADLTKCFICTPFDQQESYNVKDNTNLMNDYKTMNANNTGKLNDIFSMCDDSDIDDVLKL